MRKGTKAHRPYRGEKRHAGRLNYVFWFISCSKSPPSPSTPWQPVAGLALSCARGERPCLAARGGETELDLFVCKMPSNYARK